MTILKESLRIPTNLSLPGLGALDVHMHDFHDRTLRNRTTFAMPVQGLGKAGARLAQGLCKSRARHAQGLFNACAMPVHGKVVPAKLTS